MNLLGSLIMIFKSVVNWRLGLCEGKPEGNCDGWDSRPTSWIVETTAKRLYTRIMTFWQTFDNLRHVTPPLSLPLTTFGMGTPRCRWSIPARCSFSDCCWDVHWFGTDIQTVEIRCWIWTWHCNRKWRSRQPNKVFAEVKSPKENQANPFSLKRWRSYAVRGAGYPIELANSMQPTAKYKS